MLKNDTETHVRCKSANNNQDIVYVTGFGPFGDHVINASWEAVRRLPDMQLAGKLGCRLEIEQIPVEYEFIQREIPRRWRLLRPRLVVHVGVSDQTVCIQLERNAHNATYTRCDITGRVPIDGVCVDCAGVQRQLSTGLDLERARRACHLPTAVSCDPGRYLCDFVYYTSLSCDSASTVFIHVPPVDQPHSAEKMALALSEVVSDLYKQCSESRFAAEWASALS